MIPFLWIQKYQKKHKCDVTDCKFSKDVIEMILVTFQ